MSVLEKMKKTAARAVVPDEYDLKAIKLNALKESEGFDRYNAFCIAFYYGFAKGQRAEKAKQKGMGK